MDYSKKKRTLKNYQDPRKGGRVLKAVLKSPKRPAHKFAACVTTSDGTVSRFLHEDVKFHRFKLAVVFYEK